MPLPRESLEAYLTRLSQAASQAAQRSPVVLGYPLNTHRTAHLAARVRAACEPFTVLNNCLDPWKPRESHWKAHTADQERELVMELAEAWILPAKSQHSKTASGSVWGYITTGGTEGNLRGVQAGLDRFHNKQGSTLAIFSHEAHHSIPKSIRFHSQLRNVEVPTTSDGQMCLSAMDGVVAVAKRMGLDRFVVVPTLGTTFKGAIDDVRGIRRVLEGRGVLREHTHVHLDAAFNGGFFRHISDPAVFKPKLGVDVDSLSVSGHKWYGGFVAGVFITLSRRQAGEEGPSFVPYLGFSDNLASGSKDGFVAPMWLARLRQLDWDEEYRRCRENRDLLRELLKEHGVPSFAHAASLIVVFPEPSGEVCDKYQLATQSKFAHACIMPSVSAQDIREFVRDMHSRGDLERMAAMSLTLHETTGWPVVPGEGEEL